MVMKWEETVRGIAITYLQISIAISAFSLYSLWPIYVVRSNGCKLMKTGVLKNCPSHHSQQCNYLLIHLGT